MLRKPVYFRGQGKVKIALIAADGTVGPFHWAGNASALTLNPTVETIEHTEDYTGYGYTDMRLHHSPKLGFSFEADDYFIDSLAVLLWGDKTALTSATVTNRVVNGPFVAGTFYRIGRPGITVSGITTGAGDTAVASTKYTVNFDGTIVFNDVSGLSSSIKVSGSEPAIDALGVLSKTNQAVALKFDGLNTANGNKKFAVDIPYATLMPLSDLELISRTELARYTVEGMALYDGSTPQDGLLGGLATLSMEQ